MGEFMSYDGGDYLFFKSRGLFAHQQAGLSERDESPVLHGSCQEVWDGNQIWQRREGAYQDVCRKKGKKKQSEEG